MISIGSKKEIYFLDNEKFFIPWRVELFDPWDTEAVLKQIKKETEQSPIDKIITEDEKVFWANQYRTLAPKGYIIPIFYYKSYDNKALQFYSKDFLDADVERLNSSQMGCIVTRPLEIDNGKKVFSCFLSPIEKDCRDTLDVELFSYHESLPEKFITLN